MSSTRSLKLQLSQVFQLCQEDRHDEALARVEKLLESWPGNAQLHVLWASLVQLQENPIHGLDEVKKSLLRAAELDRGSPAGHIELGHYLDAVEDNPQGASKSFAEGIASARRLLIEGLLGQARVLLQLGKREAAFKCLLESLYLANLDSTAASGEDAAAPPDILVREPAGRLLAFQVKGPFAMKIEDLLHEFYPKRSA